MTIKTVEFTKDNNNDVWMTWEFGENCNDVKLNKNNTVSIFGNDREFDLEELTCSEEEYEFLINAIDNREI